MCYNIKREMIFIIRNDIRNIAIIAHVDHGKTTLVDSLLRQSGIFHKNQAVQDRVMDSDDIEKERGITILSKNTAVNHNGIKINIIDTPGHADFGGEVERVLKMVNGVVLLVDAFEGPMPQTKFVLKKAFELDLPVVVTVNKIDRPDARPDAVIDEVLDLFIELGADDSALESPIVYASAKSGYASLDPEVRSGDMEALFETIIENIPGPSGEKDEPLQVLISTIDYNDYVGKIGVGKIERGTIKVGDDLLKLNAQEPDQKKKIRVVQLFEFEGLDRIEVKESSAGSIVAIAGIEDINIGDTLVDPNNPEALDFVKISEPTIAMNFSVNNSPFAGQEGKFLTSREIKARLQRELQSDVGLRVEDTEYGDTFKVSGRGELHLSILIENMRREGYEFQVSKPEVLFKEEDGKKLEPMEIATIDVNSEYIGSVIEKLGQRKGEMISLEEITAGSSRAEFLIPARGLIGYRQEFLTDTKGTGVLNTIFHGYSPFKGEIPTRQSASITSFDQGEATAYGLHNAQSRGELFISPGAKVYEGMVVGSSPKGIDIEVSVTRKKKQSNVRASGSDDALRLSPPRIMSLENALEFIEDDELIEITPNSMRIRKKILDTGLRKKSHKR
jgi:GTP-binding protein